MHVFSFPEKESDFKFCSGMHDLKHRLRIHEQNFPALKTNNIYDVRQHNLNGKFIVNANCKYCKSRLKYEGGSTNPSNFRLTKFNNQHEHVIKKTDVSDAMVDFLKSGFAKVPENLLKSYFFHKFEQSATQQKYEKAFEIARKQSEKKSFIDELHAFGKHNFMSMIEKSHLRVNPNPNDKNAGKQSYPIFLFISTIQMKCLYERFGKIIYLHRFPYLIQKDSFGAEDWIVIIISGFDNFNSIVFYGFSICYGLTLKSIFLTLKSFFEHFPIQKCETIITQNEDVFLKGVTEFLDMEAKKTEVKPKIVHLLDLMLNVKDSNEERQKVLKKMISSSSEKQFDNTMKEYRRKTKGTDGVKFQMFIQKAARYCLLQIPSTFVGIGLGLDHFGQIFNWITSNFPEQLDYNIFVFRFTKFLKYNKISRGRTTLLTKVLITPLSDCYPVISEYALNYLYNTLIQSNMVNFVPNQGFSKIKVENNVVDIHKVVVNKNIIDVQEPIDEKNVISSNQNAQKGEVKLILQCDCNMKRKTGLPCAHIMRICLYYNVPISTQIDEFWDTRRPTNHKKQEQQRAVRLHRMSFRPLTSKQ